MKHFLSIGALLAAITGLFVVVLVSIFAIFADGAYEHKRDATQILLVVNDMRSILSYKESLRDEMSVIDTALDASNGASTGTVNQTIALHTKSEDALASLGRQLKTQPSIGTMPGLEILRRSAVYSKLFPEVIAAVKLPIDQRPRNLAADFVTAVDNLGAAISDQSSALSGSIVSADPFINEMMKTNAVA